MPNLINAERVTVTYGTRALLNAVSLGIDDGDAIGVVGRNGDGKTTLLRTLTGQQTPDSGRVTHTGGLSVGYLGQDDELAASGDVSGAWGASGASGVSVRALIVGGRADHIWAAEASTRTVVEHLLSGVDLDAPVAVLSGGERRRVALVAMLLGGHDVLALD
ncbi:MAG: ABC-F family ATP-binding cassette domain-containing protein, partial [Mycobacteriaceae bacterium]|nr:ABC-F family ATP-binding cassette domain-containing protein [Mycobacteriaceae bacterium]